MAGEPCISCKSGPRRQLLQPKHNPLALHLPNRQLRMLSLQPRHIGLPRKSAGVPQGSSASPNLLNFFVSTSENSCELVLSYVDDVHAAVSSVGYQTAATSLVSTLKVKPIGQKRDNSESPPKKPTSPCSHHTPKSPINVTIIPLSYADTPSCHPNHTPRYQG